MPPGLQAHRHPSRAPHSVQASLPTVLSLCLEPSSLPPFLPNPAHSAVLSLNATSAGTSVPSADQSLRVSVHSRRWPTSAEGPESEYFRLCGTEALCPSDSSLLLGACQGDRDNGGTMAVFQRDYVQKQAWAGFFTGSYESHMPLIKTVVK